MGRKPIIYVTKEQADFKSIMESRINFIVSKYPMIEVSQKTSEFMQDLIEEIYRSGYDQAKKEVEKVK